MGPAMIAAAALVAVAPPVLAVDILFTAETGFQPLPCDCPTNPLGGWAQRAALVDSLRSSDAAGSIVVVDGGGWLAGGITSELAALTAEAMALMGYDAINVGAPDLVLIEGDFRTFRSLPLVCGHPDRPSAVPAWRVVETGGHRVGVIGAAWFGSGVLTPAEQVERALADLPEVDARLVLCAGGMGPARTIASTGLPIDVVIYGEGARTPEPVSLGGPVGVAPGSKGRYLGWLVLDPDRSSPRLTLVPVRPELSGPPRIQTIALNAAMAREGGTRGYLRKTFSYRGE